MTLVDTSIWIDHLRGTTKELAAALDRSEVLMHPFVVGEIACGNLKDRETVLELLQQLPSCALAEPDEVLAFVGKHRLFGRGIGYVDAHLLASAMLQGVAIWTRDQKLRTVSGQLGLKK